MNRTKWKEAPLLHKVVTVDDFETIFLEEDKPLVVLPEDPPLASED